MTDQELQKLSRTDLLQMLLKQGEELHRLREQYAEAQEALSDRTIRLEQAGSIAEAALQLNGVFEAAQAACRQYTENIIALSQRQEAVSAKLEAESRQKAEELLARTQAQCDAMLQQARTEAQAYWNAVSKKVSAISPDHSDLHWMLCVADEDSAS